MGLLPGGGRLDQRIQKEAQISDQMEGGVSGVVRNVKHNVPHLLRLLHTPGAIDGLFGAQSGFIEILRCPHSVKFQPYIFPGLQLICAVHIDLAGRNQKALPGLQLKTPVGSVRRGGIQEAAAGDYVVKQVMIADGGAKGVERRALLPASLKQFEVQYLLIGKDGKRKMIHIAHG